MNTCRQIIKFVIVAATLTPATSGQAVSQTIPDEQASGFAIEKYTEATESEAEFQEPESLNELSGMGGLDLNKATPEDLQALPVISTRQAESLLSYISTYGSLLSVYELKSVPGFDSATIRKLLPYVRTGPVVTGPPLTLNNLLRFGHQELTLRYQQVLQQKEGYRSGIYAGSPQKYFFRYAYSFSDKIRMGLGGEKDPGEALFGPDQPLGLDFYSGYVSVGNMGILRTLVIGNFAAGFGQGLVISSGSRMGSVIGFGTTLRTSQGLRGSTSMNETGSLRGIGATIKPGRFTLSLFISRQKRDPATSSGDTLEQVPFTVSSLGGSGYHRTASEIAGKGNVKETVYGGNLTFTGNFFRIGFTGAATGWDAIIEPRDAPYTRFSIRGSSVATVGLEGVVRLRSVSFFGEAGTTLGKGHAWIAGIQAQAAQNLSLVFVLRNYERDYCNPWAGAAGQNSLNANERGALATLNARVHRNIDLSVFADLHEFPWLKYRVNGPSSGAETGLLVTVRLSAPLILSTRYTYSRGTVNNSAAPDPVHPLEESSSSGTRILLSWQVSETLALKTLFGTKTCSKGNLPHSQGYLLSQDLSCSLFRTRAGLALNYTLFDIPSYDLRIYVHEPDVLYSVSVPAFQGRGIRVMGRATFTLSRHLGLWAWFGMTWYEDREVIGTGNEMIMGNKVSEIKLQVRLRN